MNTATIESESPVQKRSPRLKVLGWVGFGLAALILFTIAKIPDTRIVSYIDSQISRELGRYGMGLTSREARLSIFTGIRYTLTGVSPRLPDQSTVELDRMSVSPSIFKLLTGRTGASIRIDKGEARVHADLSLKQQSVQAEFSLKNLGLRDTGILSQLGGLKGNGVLSGKGDLQIDISNLSTLDGSVDLKLAQLDLDPQRLYGFNIPRISVGETVLSARAESGTVTIRKFQVGKKNSKDDLTAEVTGFMNLGQTTTSSTVNLDAKFALSDSVKKSFVLLDTLLAAGRQSDGSYGYKIAGPLSGPIPSPLGK